MSSRSAFQFPIYFMPDVFSRVYPYHMAKGLRTMRRLVYNCDCVVEIRDARVPLSSFNPQFDELYAHKHRIILLNKIDIADEHKTKDLARQLIKESDNVHVLFSNCKAQYSKVFTQLMPIFKKIFAQQNETKSRPSVEQSADLLNRQYKVLVCGIPNVGKSSFINAARRNFMSKGGKATPVGKKPGVTRSVLQTITISRSPKIKLLDTPDINVIGIISPEITDPFTGIKLALTGTYPDHVVGEEVIADYLLYCLNKQGNTSYLRLCGLSAPSDNFDETISSMASTNGFLLFDGSPNYRKCAIQLIKAFRSGEFGKMTLDEI